MLTSKKYDIINKVATEYWSAELRTSQWACSVALCAWLNYTIVLAYTGSDNNPFLCFWPLAKKSWKHCIVPPCKDNPIAPFFSPVNLLLCVLTLHKCIIMPDLLCFWKVKTLLLFKCLCFFCKWDAVSRKFPSSQGKCHPYCTIDVGCLDEGLRLKSFVIL